MEKSIEKTAYPKVLVVGISFIPNTGSGITISNLFRNWPKDKLAVANDIIDGSDRTICENYYLLESHFAKKSTKAGSNVINKGQGGFKNKLKRSLRFLYAGIKNYSVLKGKYQQIKIDDAFLNWVDDFKPDIIYSMPRGIIQIPFLINVSKHTKIPLAVHIVDDWVNINYFGILNPIGKKILNKEFRKLLARSKALMSISRQMQLAYKKRYKRDFVPFHNPIQIEKWESLSRNDQEQDGAFKIMFAGTVEEYNIDEIETLCKAISGDENIIFNIYGSIRSSAFVETLQKYSNCHIKGLVSSEKVFGLLVHHDLLFLPLSFNEKMKNNILLSMPTKISEYMISGTPTLVYAHEDLALTKYALKSDWAYVITEPGKKKLSEGVEKLKNDTSLRASITEKAIKVAKENHDSKIVQNNFVEVLLNAIK